MNKLTLTAAAAVFGSLGIATAANAATIVDLELALVIDSSGSISSSDFQSQLDAYQNVFTNPNFYSSLIAPLAEEGGEGQIALSAYQFGSSVEQSIGWTLIDSQAAATDFGNAFMNVTNGAGFTTNMSAGINTAVEGLLNNEFAANRLVIDISTDGAPNNRFSATQASIDAINSGVDAINALGVGSGVDGDYLENSIVRGTNSFYIEVDDFDASFQTALENKIEREITEVIDDNDDDGDDGDDGNGGNGGNPTPAPTTTPEPTTMAALLGFSFVGLVSRRRNKTV